jgi:hypothetical protein
MRQGGCSTKRSSWHTRSHDLPHMHPQLDIYSPRQTPISILSSILQATTARLSTNGWKCFPGSRRRS